MGSKSVGKSGSGCIRYCDMRWLVYLYQCKGVGVVGTLSSSLLKATRTVSRARPKERKWVGVVYKYFDVRLNRRSEIS